MAVAPEHFRAARLAIPRLHLSAIFGFVFLGVGGSLFLAYTAFNHSEEKHFVAASNDPHVYAARAIPFDASREDPAQRAASIARALTAAQTNVRHAEGARFDLRSQNSNRIVVTQSDRELRGFSQFASFDGDSSYLTVAGGTKSGISSETAPSGFFAADAATFESSAVPEASTWFCGCALFVLVAARGAHAHWHRKRHRP
jgi:hypothetical protein